MRAIVALLVLAAAPAAAEEWIDRVHPLPPVLVAGQPEWSLDERMRHHRVAAVSVAVFRGDRVVWEGARGLADVAAGRAATVDTLFQAGSISKPVAAAGVMRLVEMGTLDLTKDVNGYLRSWKLPESPLAAKRPVSLELILAHGAGLSVHGFPGYEPGAPIPTLPQILDGVAPANTEPVRVIAEPGAGWRYSGGGYTIAQLVVSDVSRRPFPALMRELVLGPAGMTRSSYEQPLPPDRLQLAAVGYRPDAQPVGGLRHVYPEMAAAGLWTTAGDLARFAIAVERARRGEAGALLGRALAERMTTPFVGVSGLGFFIEKRGDGTFFGHGGADEGFRALLVAHIGDAYGAAIMVNSDNGDLLEEVLRGVARAEGWPGYLPAPLQPVALTPAQAARFAGRWAFDGDDALAIAARGGRLFARTPVGDEVELFAAGRDELVRADEDVRYRLAKGALSDGKRVARRLAPGARLPSEELAAGRIAAAVAGYRKLRQRNDPAAAEDRLNRRGYELAAHGDMPQAIALLQLATELYPTSANAYDSLGEIVLRSGDRKRALELYRKLLEVLPLDEKASPGLKDQLRGNAKAKVAELD